MAYLTFAGSEDKQNCYSFIGADLNTNSSSVLIGGHNEQPISLLASNFGGGEDSCSFYNGPSDSVIYAFGESTETSGSIAYTNSSTETSGSVAFSTGEASTTVVSYTPTNSSSSSSSFTCCC